MVDGAVLVIWSGLAWSVFLSILEFALSSSLPLLLRLIFTLIFGAWLSCCSFV